MQIKAIRATPVLIPLEAPYLWSYGALAGFTKTIVEVETSDGLVGIAEAPSHSSAAIIARMAEALVGHDPLDVAGFGGFSAMLRFVSACAGAGIDFWCYSGGSGLETAAYLHACAAHPHIREPNQSLLRQQPHDVIAEGPFSPKNNHIALPKGPGLGVTLDADRIAYCARLLVENGVPNKYHDPAAPGQMRRMPLV